MDKKQLPFVTVTMRRDRILLDPMKPELGFADHLVETVDTSEFDKALLAHLADRAQHRFTVGVAAPWPAHEILRPICEAIERGESFDLEHADQFLYDWQSAQDFNAKRDALPAAAKATIAPEPMPVADTPTIWGRVVDAWNVLTGKVKV